MKIASWNVNSLNVRLPHLQAWLSKTRPDVVALQETKLEDARFPDGELATLGYRSVFAGQKAYNGVAILARDAQITDVREGIAGFEDPQKRVLAATVNGVRIINVYVVNGQSVGSEKYDYKLRWLAALHQALDDELRAHPQLVLLGDFNIAPDDGDVHDPARWNDDHILTSTAERTALRGLQAASALPRQRLPADVAAAKAFRPFDAVDGLIGALLRLRYCLAHSANVQHAATAGENFSVFRDRSGMKDFDAFDFCGLIEA